ncbi:hypothetical protein RHMOL_Rhmol10G0025500 [Rhododendron molle]|uniref:Uncharacterized protein n=1 Tax=Rhododendron molle TaxID=49168 RepID=A0ACC0LZ52_RHOML|nr:hypothetical protein RHMOL_Rhmol10G0025500 [Rhododendron molle]
MIHSLRRRERPDPLCPTDIRTGACPTLLGRRSRISTAEMSRARFGPKRRRFGPKRARLISAVDLRDRRPRIVGQGFRTGEWDRGSPVEVSRRRERENVVVRHRRPSGFSLHCNRYKAVTNDGGNVSTYVRRCSLQQDQWNVFPHLEIPSFFQSFPSFLKQWSH